MLYQKQIQKMNLKSIEQLFPIIKTLTRRELELNDLVKYRLESAKDRLRSSRVLLDNGQFKDSIGRSYYAIFTAVRAVLAIDKVDFSKHSGVIAYFQREYVKTGLIDMTEGIP